MREYKIFKTKMWWGIYKRKQVWKILMVSFLSSKGEWTIYRDNAKVFYTEDDAMGHLVIMKAKDARKNSD